MYERPESIKHASFGMLGFTRAQCGGDGLTLHGSNLKHNTFIEMTLSHGSMRRDLSHNWYHAEGRITTVRMSQNQFAELITSMNMGDGIPVTLAFTETEGRIKEPELESVVELHENEFKDQNKQSIQEAKELLESVKSLLKGSGTVKKADRETIISAVEKLERDIGPNTDYRIECFKEAIDKTVTDAKGTIEAFYQKRVIDAGVQALEQQPSHPQLAEK